MLQCCGASSSIRVHVHELLLSGNHPNVYLLDREEESTSLDVLCNAFDGDRAFMWTHEGAGLSDEEILRRTRITTRHEVHWTLHSCFQTGLCLGVYDMNILCGVAVIYPPGVATDDSILTFISNRLTLGPPPTSTYTREWGQIPARRDLAWDDWSCAHHEHHMRGQPHWYLPFIGVSKERQGQGFGKRLLNLVVQLSDRTGHPIYLETESSKNETLYQKFGFVTLEQTEVNADVPNCVPFRHLYFMRREAGHELPMSESVFPPTPTTQSSEDEDANDEFGLDVTPALTHSTAVNLLSLPLSISTRSRKRALTRIGSRQRIETHKDTPSTHAKTRHSI